MSSAHVFGELAHMLTHGTELPTSRDHSRGGGDLTQVTTSLQFSKRQLDAASTDVPSPAKRAPSAQTDTHRGKHSAMLARGVEHANVPQDLQGVVQGFKDSDLPVAEIILARLALLSDGRLKQILGH